MSRGRTYTLRNAASIVFALTAVIPLLLFTYTLYALNQLKLTAAQMGLGVALACALVGLFIFSNLMARLSEVLRYLEEQQDSAGRTGTTAAASATPGAGGDAAARPAATGAGNSPAAAVFPGGLLIPRLGPITAANRAASAARPAAGVFDEVQKTMWQARGPRPLRPAGLISVKNPTQPLQARRPHIAADAAPLDPG